MNPILGTNTHFRHQDSVISTPPPVYLLDIEMGLDATEEEQLPKYTVLESDPAPRYYRVTVSRRSMVFHQSRRRSTSDSIV